MTQLTLKQWMAVREMTVLQFASAIGVSYPTVSNWRVGHTKPNAKYIPVIEQTLGIDYKDIIRKINIEIYWKILYRVDFP